jgi:hypothetical protein
VRLTALHVYPLKSAAGIAVGSVEVDEVGLRHDRRWMLVDDAGRFVSQRTHPRMALVRTALADGRLRVSAPEAGTLELPMDPPEGGGEIDLIRVWHSDRYAVDCGREAAEWASSFLGLPCRVVRAVEPQGRERVSEEGKVRAGFADAEPALVVSLASLDALNARLAEPVPMDRFRPNLVVAGVPAHGEDGWGPIRIGDVPARGVRPCPRCVLPTVDQRTGVAGREPLRTLARYRRGPSGEVYFGMNARFEGEGVLEVGMGIVEAGATR